MCYRTVYGHPLDKLRPCPAPGALSSVKVGGKGGGRDFGPAVNFPPPSALGLLVTALVRMNASRNAVSTLAIPKRLAQRTVRNRHRDGIAEVRYPAVGEAAAPPGRVVRETRYPAPTLTLPLTLSSAGLRQACPEGIFMSLTPGDPTLWSGVMFVRKGARRPPRAGRGVFAFVLLLTR